MTALLALDLSLTSTGAAWTNDPLAPSCATLKSRHTGCERLADLRDQIVYLATDVNIDVALVEGYSFASKQGGERLGELGGVIRVALHEHGVPVVEVPPAVVKKVATGKGNAPKPAVLAEAVRRLGYAGSSTDEADALWLLQAAGQWFRLPWAVKLPATHLDGLGKVAWPKLAREVVA